MSFASILDAYCNTLGCTNREIAEECGISPSALSRYRNGVRTPEIGSDALDRLVSGIARLSTKGGGGKRLEENAVREALEGSLSGSQLLGMSFGARVNALMALLDLRNAEVASAVGISPSYVSRIRNGQRMPADQRNFVYRISQLASQRCVERGKVNELISLIDSAGNVVDKDHLDLDSDTDLSEVIGQWLVGSNIVETDLMAVENLFSKLNRFYFDSVLEKIRGQVPAEPSSGDDEPMARFHYGLESMWDAEMSFFEISANRGASEVHLSSDMPLLEVRIDPSLIDKYQQGVGKLVSQGAHIVAIHSADRPLYETCIALEVWIPLYLTGRVTPYFLRGVNNRLFCHVNYISDTCALSAEAVAGHRPDGRYYLSTRPEDIAYYQKKMGYIMEHVSTMIEVCDDDGLKAKLLENEIPLGKGEDAGGRIVGAGKYENLRIVSYPGSCAVVTILRDPAIHIVIRHPKLRYVIAHMR